MWFLSKLLEHLITRGTLRCIDAGGNLHEFSGEGGPCVTFRLHDKSLHRRIFLNPNLALGEAYTDGTLTIEEGTIYDFLDLIGRNVAVAKPHPLRCLYTERRTLSRFLQQYNPVGLSRKRIAHHYDLSDRLYGLFLDSDRQYSCAYFKSGNQDLETAQEDKKRHIAAKLLLRPGLRILDIGSGWGGLALYLARISDSEVTGITLSEEQVGIARRRAREAGLFDRTAFYLRDYREQEGVFDRIVSVGMFEHVGVDHYRKFFSKVRDLIAEDGVILLHSIGSMDRPQDTNPWIRKYIFPGGYCPALSEVLKAVEKVGLWVCDVEILRLHYADTLREWRRRFLVHRDEIAGLYDERFCRLWEYYLALCEMAFRHRGLMVFQMQLAKTRDAVPIIRDYITDWEREHA